MCNLPIFMPAAAHASLVSNKLMGMATFTRESFGMVMVKGIMDAPTQC